MAETPCPCDREHLLPPCRDWVSWVCTALGEMHQTQDGIAPSAGSEHKMVSCCKPLFLCCGSNKTLCRWERPSAPGLSRIANRYGGALADHTAWP
jgi:hypothetical protein